MTAPDRSSGAGEMTGCDPLLLPVVAANLVAHAVAQAMGSRPIYTSLLDRTLEQR